MKFFGVLILVFLTFGCSTTQYYDGPKRDKSEVVTIKYDLDTINIVAVNGVFKENAFGPYRNIGPIEVLPGKIIIEATQRAWRYGSYEKRYYTSSIIVIEISATGGEEFYLDSVPKKDEDLYSGAIRVKDFNGSIIDTFFEHPERNLYFGSQDRLGWATKDGTRVGLKEIDSVMKSCNWEELKSKSKKLPVKNSPHFERFKNGEISLDSLFIADGRACMNEKGYIYYWELNGNETVYRGEK